MAVQKYQYNYSPDNRGGLTITPQKNSTDIDDLIKNYGITVDDRLLLDNSMEALNIPTRQTIGGIFSTMVNRPVKIPNQISVSSGNMNDEYSITNRIPSLLYLWGTALEIKSLLVRYIKWEPFSRINEPR